MANNGSSRSISWIIVALIIVGVAGAIAWHMFAHQNSGPSYQTTEVTRDDVIQAVTATGTLNPVTNVLVGSQISGNIEKLYADWNSPVKANQVVAQIDPASYKSAVEQADGDLSNAMANLELTQVEAKREDELFNNKLVSESDHDTAIATYHQAEATVEMKKAALDNAKVNLERCTIYSPVDGIVIQRSVDVGQTVAASLSAPTIFIIANDLTKMQIDAQVAEADVGGVEEGQHVDFRVDAFPFRTFIGKVQQIRNSPTNYQNVVSYDSVISVDNSDLKLRPGMTATVSIVIGARTNVIKIPNSALRFHPPEMPTTEVKSNRVQMASAGPANAPGAHSPGTEKGHGPGQHGEHSMARTVYVLDKSNKDAKPTPVQIKVGISDGIYTEVKDGLTEGQEVVTGLSIPSDQAGGAQGNPFGGGRGFRRF
ncbi:MAG TPA: efflux RND transporter periplasmic adaptor subunit [Verrucomicrobiae bacterium]|nr:efflux RND transporter periplasmic adaptor subunit [Verrucomicrobiae bacterium]